MAVTYQVIGAVVSATVPGQFGSEKRYFYRRAMLPPEVSATEIAHLLSVKLIAPVSMPTPEMLVAQSVPMAEPAGVQAAGDTGGHATDPPPPAGDAGATTAGNSDVEAQRAEAQAKLEAAGGKPTGRHGQAVWVEHLVALGYDFEAVKDASKEELQRIAEGIESR